MMVHHHKIKQMNANNDYETSSFDDTTIDDRTFLNLCLPTRSSRFTAPYVYHYFGVLVSVSQSVFGEIKNSNTILMSGTKCEKIKAPYYSFFVLTQS
jgi:hypothetical protein